MKEEDEKIKQDSEGIQTQVRETPKRRLHTRKVE